MDLLTSCLQWWTTDRATVFLNFGLLTAAVLSAFAAFRAVRENRQIAINASRPMMTAEVLPPSSTHSTLRFQVSNKGQSMAKNLRVSFEPPLPELDVEVLNEKTDPGVTFNRITPIDLVNAMFRNRIFSTWTPGVTSSVAYWTAPSGFDPAKELPYSAEGVPPDQRIIFDYEDELGNSYSEEFELNVALILGVEFLESSNGTVEKNLKKLEQSVTNGFKDLHQISKKVLETDQEKEQEANRIQKAKAIAELIRQKEKEV